MIASHCAVAAQLHWEAITVILQPTTPQGTLSYGIYTVHNEDTKLGYPGVH